jgi:hypothetical protein
VRVHSLTLFAFFALFAFPGACDATSKLPPWLATLQSLCLGCKPKVRVVASCERGKFKVAKFSNRITRLIHQMWDEMMIVILIEKDLKMVTTFETTQIDIEGSLMIRVPKKKKKG